MEMITEMPVCKPLRQLRKLQTCRVPAGALSLDQQPAVGKRVPHGGGRPHDPRVESLDS